MKLFGLVLLLSCVSVSAAAQTFTVTYNANGATGGTVPTDATAYAQSATVTVQANTGAMVRTGRVFTGWNTVSNALGTAYAATGSETFSMPAANVTLWAQWGYTLSYDGNGATSGTVPASQSAQRDIFTVSDNVGGLTKTGFIFGRSTSGFFQKSWNLSADGTGNPAIVGDTPYYIPADTTVYAMWTPAYGVTYDANGATGGTAPTDNTPYAQFMTVTALANSGSLVKAGSAFAGWNTAANGSGTTYAATGAVTFSMPAANRVLYAKWTVTGYSVTYNANGATGGAVPTDNSSYAQSATVTVRANTGTLVRTGRVFTGWNTVSNGLGTAYAATGSETFSMPAANVVLWAQWGHTLSYDGNGATGGCPPPSQTAQLDIFPISDNVGALVKTGFIFGRSTGGVFEKAWNQSADGTGLVAIVGAPAYYYPADTTLYARWTPAFGVTYDANGATGGTVPTDSTPYAQFMNVTALANTGSLVKAGSTFAGWNTAANGSGTTIAASGSATFSMPAANRVLYAKWTVIPTYTVTYFGNGSTGGTVPVDGTAYLQGNAVTVRANTGTLVKTGSTFGGWNTAPNGVGTAYAATGSATFNIGAANVSLYARWATSSSTGPSPTSTGTITAVFTGGDAGCGFNSQSFIPVTGHEYSPPTGTAPTGLAFPHGLFYFVVGGCTSPGGTLNFTVTYPQALPAGTQLWKYGPTPTNSAPHWYVVPATISGNTATVTVTDGGLGDDDLVANGTIVDPVGPGAPADVPTMNQWLLGPFALFLLGVGAQRVRARGVSS